MLKIATLATLLSVAVAAPGYTHVAPEEFHQVYAPVYSSAPKQVVEPHDVTYTRTDVISTKITSSAPHPHASHLVPHVPHSIKNSHYTEENIVRGQPAPVQIDGPEIEANYRKIEINVPQLPQSSFDAQQQLQALALQQLPIPEPPRPLHPHPEEISAPILRPYPQPTFPKSSERLAPGNALPKTAGPNIARSESLIQQPKTTSVARVPLIYAHLTPLGSIEAPSSVGYPISAAKVTDFRRTFYTPISSAVRSSVIVGQPLIAGSEPYNDEVPANVQKLPLKTAVTKINHGNGAVSNYYY